MYIHTVMHLFACENTCTYYMFLLASQAVESFCGMHIPHMAFTALQDSIESKRVRSIT